MSAGRADEAVVLAERFYARFPEDGSVASVYIGLLKEIGHGAEAEKVYGEFKRRLWREHRLKPSFGIGQNQGP